MASTNISTPSLQSHIDTGNTNSNPRWREAALAATTRLAGRQARFTSYDVLQELAKTDITTHDLRSIGGVMQEARDLGLITSMGLVRRNNKNTRGATTLWESRIYQSTPTAHANSQPSEETQPQ
jgi:hypothetical protein